MNLLISSQFLLLFFAYSYFFIKLIKKGFSFSLGIVFGILYFIFIPLSVFITTGIVEISLLDFSNTNLTDVVMEDRMIESLILIAYLYSILVFVYFSEFFQIKNEIINEAFPLAWKSYFLLSLLVGISIFLAAGIHQGGNWYLSRELFFKESGMLALILTFAYSAMKILFIVSLLTAYEKRKIAALSFVLAVVLFSVIDVVLTGNRIYVFVLFGAISILLLGRYGLKVLLFGFLIIPLGYMMSIYRHVRGELFLEGIPSIGKAIDMISASIVKEPPAIESFLLGISESVNFNVLYEIFDYINFNNALWGGTFLKAFVFLIPRSLWQDKPLSITQIAGEWFAPQSEHLSLVTTIIGEIHANFYFFGIAMLPLILIVTDKLMKKMFSHSTFANILLFVFGLLIFRMPYSDILLVSIFVFVFYKVILMKTSMRSI